MSSSVSYTVKRFPRLAFWFTFHALSRIPPVRNASRKALVRGWYEIVSLFDRHAHVTFMNYGYAPLDSSDGVLALPDDQEVNRYSIQLYEHIARAVDLTGKDVVEIGCGRGGGAHFIMQHFRPRSVIGVDFAAGAVTFCQRQYLLDGLAFMVGDAEKLPLPSSAFDIVVSVESSHNYPDMPRFLGEVVRVLRPKGYFLFADHRPLEEVDSLREQLKRSGLTLREEEPITANVVRALELDSERRVAAIRSRVPKVFQPTLEEFSAVKGSDVHQRLRTGKLQYLRFVLQKP